MGFNQWQDAGGVGRLGGGLGRDEGRWGLGRVEPEAVGGEGRRVDADGLNAEDKAAGRVPEEAYRADHPFMSAGTRGAAGCINQPACTKREAASAVIKS